MLAGCRHPFPSFVPGGWGGGVLTGVQFCSFVAHLPSASPAYRVFVFNAGGVGQQISQVFRKVATDPASNALVPNPVSKYVDQKLTNFGWDAAEGVLAKGRSAVSDAVGNFVNGVVSYSGAPTTYSPQYGSYRDEDYQGPGWDAFDATIGGLKQAVSGGVASSGPVESLKSVSFDPSAGEGVLSVASGAGTGSGAVLVDEVTEVPGE